jgi:hypothetical protein
MKIGHLDLFRASSSDLKTCIAKWSTRQQRIWRLLCSVILVSLATTPSVGSAQELPSPSSDKTLLDHNPDPAVDPATHAVALFQGGNLWELSTAVAPPCSHPNKSCSDADKSGRFFVSVGVHRGGSSPGTGDNAVLLRGDLVRNSSGRFVVKNEPPTEQYQEVLFPLRSPSDPDDRSFADNVMSRTPDGAILLLRDLALDTLPFPKLDDGAGLWASEDAGNTWEFRSFLDPADTTSFPPPELIDGSDPNASYAADRVNDLLPGWDREELYADPFRSGDVYATMRPGAGINNEGTGDKYFDTLLARSRDGGRTWRSFALVPNAIVVPVMMTSNPGRLFMFNCEGPPGVPELTRPEAILRWSDDRGQSVTGRFIISAGLSSDFACASVGEPEGWGFEGSQGISRVRYLEFKLDDLSIYRRDVVRVTYPGITAAGQQVVQVFEIELITGRAPAARLVTTLAAPDAHVVQAAVVEPDPSEVAHALINKRLAPFLTVSLLAPRLGTALVTWKLLRRSGPVTLQGAFVRQRTGDLGSAFDISEWPGRSKTGDYSRVAFFYADGHFNYFVPWIAEDATGQRTLMATTITPRRR